MTELTATTEVREAVRQRYASAARGAASGAEGKDAGSACCRSGVETVDAAGREIFGGALHASADVEEVPSGAVSASLGCGVPTAVADRHEGDCCSSAEREDCCEPAAKESCCGTRVADPADHAPAPRCGCR